jgi:3',5'-cyclic AMP phosphodiesterase CpdA
VRDVAEGRLWATSDLHVGYAENRRIVSGELRPETPDDWLIVAGDVSETPSDVEWALGTLAERFAQVIWTPGNHELYTHPKDPCQLRGLERYEHLVKLCAGMGVLTPEDPYPQWTGAGGPVTIAPLFALYDYSFRMPGIEDAEQAVAAAREAGVVATDEAILHPDPYPDRSAWCRARIEETEARLAALPAGTRTVLVNHWPMTRLPTRVLRHPQFAIWCGTERTADWHVRFNAAVVIYGHLHIPRTTYEDGVRFEEVSVGYPREWHVHHHRRGVLRDVFPSVDPIAESF